MEDLNVVSCWLRDLDVEVSRFEDDFSNGYLLGMVLYRYGYQEDFGQFCNKQNYALGNIGKVQLALEKFDIRFDPHRIVNKEPGYAKKLLEKIYKALHAKHNNQQTAIKKRSISDTPLISKNTNPSNRLKRFDDFRIAQAELVLIKEQNQRDLSKQIKLKERNHQIETLNTNRSFVQSLKKEGIQNWLKNQQRKKNRLSHDLDIKNKFLNDKKHKQKSLNNSYIQSINEGIDEFEKNMVRLGIDYSGDRGKKIVKKNLAIETAATIAKIKENIIKNAEAAKERELGQREFIIEMKKNDIFEIYKKGSRIIFVRLEKLHKAYLEHAFFRIFAYFRKMKKAAEVEKNISMYQALVEEKWGDSIKKRQEELENLENIAKIDSQEKRKKFEKRLFEEKNKVFKKKLNICKPIVEDMIYIAENAFEYLSHNKKIPQDLWGKWLDEFKYKNESQSNNESNKKTHKKERKGFIETTKDGVENYIEGKGKWGPLPNNYEFSDVLYHIIDVAFPLSQAQPMPPGPHYLPLKILLIGPMFSGKKSQAKKIAETFGLRVFEMTRIIEDAKKIMQKKPDPEDLKKKKVPDEESEMFIQACHDASLQDEVGKSKLFRSKIRGIFGDARKPEQEEQKKLVKKEEPKFQGFILSGYPTNLQEAIHLERTLSGFVHPSEMSIETRDIKKKDEILLVKPRPKDIEPIKLYKSAWDLIIWLDLNENEAIKRAKDRRVDPAGNVYSLSVNPPPDNIMAKCKIIDKPSEDQIKVDYSNLSSQKKSLFQWFSQFGIKNVPIFHFCQASEAPDQVFDCVKSKIHEILSLKTSQLPSDSPVQPKFSQISALKLYTSWDQFKTLYLGKLNKVFHVYSTLWNDFNNSLSSLKSIFFELISQEDQKILLTKNFVLEFNDLLSKKSIFSKHDSQVFYEKIDCISDELWDIVNQKKQIFIEKRKQMIHDYSLNDKLIEIFHIARDFYKAELMKHIYEIRIMSLYGKICEGYDIEVNDGDEDMRNDFIKAHENYKIILETKDFISKQELSYRKIGEFSKIKEDNKNQVKKIVKKIERDFLSAVNQDLHQSEEGKVYAFRVLKISQWAESKCHLFNKLADDAFNKLDQWITQYIQLQNEAINNFIKSLHESFARRLQISYDFPKNSEILSALNMF